jgi:hypothetical protein
MNTDKPDIILDVKGVERWGVKFTEELGNEKPTRARHEDEIHYGYT